MKSKLHEMMQQDREFTLEDDERLNPCGQTSISNALKFITNPVRACQRMHALISSLITDIEIKRKEVPDSDLYHGETWELMARR